MNGYTIKRVVEEIYYVEAETKKEALNSNQFFDPSCITILKEIIIEIKKITPLEENYKINERNKAL